MYIYIYIYVYAPPSRRRSRTGWPAAPSPDDSNNPLPRKNNFENFENNFRIIPSPGKILKSELVLLMDLLVDIFHAEEGSRAKTKQRSGTPPPELGSWPRSARPLKSRRRRFGPGARIIIIIIIIIILFIRRRRRKRRRTIRRMIISDNKYQHN